MASRRPPLPTDLAKADKPRPAPELWQLVLRPLTMALTATMARRRIDPQAVVWFHSLLGLVAAGLIALGQGPPTWWAAALLLQLKTVLDNVDGSLARATGQVTVMGRYLDTVLDTFVNLLLFLALAVHGPGWIAWPLALGAYLVLMLLFSLDFNFKRLHREALAAADGGGAGSGVAVVEPPDGARPGVLAFFRGVYEAVLAPQDRAIQRWDAATHRRIAGRLPEEAPAHDRLAWHDRGSAAALANVGLSTQFLLLGLCLIAGRPFLYVHLVFLIGAYAVLLQWGRVRRLRRRAS